MVSQHINYDYTYISKTFHWHKPIPTTHFSTFYPLFEVHFTFGGTKKFYLLPTRSFSGLTYISPFCPFVRVGSEARMGKLTRTEWVLKFVGYKFRLWGLIMLVGCLSVRYHNISTWQKWTKGKSSIIINSWKTYSEKAEKLTNHFHIRRNFCDTSRDIEEGSLSTTTKSQF